MRMEDLTDDLAMWRRCSHPGATMCFRVRSDRIHGEDHEVAGGDPRARIERFATRLRGQGCSFDRAPKRRRANYGMFFAWRPDRVAAPRRP